MDQEQIKTITDLNLQCLLNKLQNSELSAELVLKAYTRKAIEATEATNCVTEFLYNEALETTRKLDKLSPELRGPLHGLPFSVKEHYFIKGQEATVGLYSRLGRKAKNNAALGMMHIAQHTMICNVICLESLHQMLIFLARF